MTVGASGQFVCTGEKIDYNCPGEDGCDCGTCAWHADAGQCPPTTGRRCCCCGFEYSPVVENGAMRCVWVGCDRLGAKGDGSTGSSGPVSCGGCPEGGAGCPGETGCACGQCSNGSECCCCGLNYAPIGPGGSCAYSPCGGASDGGGGGGGATGVQCPSGENQCGVYSCCPTSFNYVCVLGACFRASDPAAACANESECVGGICLSGTCHYLHS
jgi:hypothetical protein